MESGILIIGAGLAGLAAAERLGKTGLPVTLLEARGRLGGRVWTRHRPEVHHPIELGAEWIDARGVAADLLRDGGEPVEKARGRRYVREPHGLEHNEALYDKRVLKALRKDAARDRPVREALSRCCRDASWGDGPLTLVRYVEGFHGADPARLSLRWLLEVEKHQSADRSASRAPGGAGRIAERLAEQFSEYCSIRLETVVHSVRWKRGAVTVEATTPTGPEEFEAGAAIVTLPLPILQLAPTHPFAVRFTPRLATRARALDKLATGHVLKVALVFREEFWRDAGPLDDMLFLHDYAQPIPTWWTMHPREVPLLSGWVAGPGADQLAGTSTSGLLDAAVDSLAGALGVPRSRVEEGLVSGHLHDWREDPFAMGAYSNVLVGGLEAWRTLAAPLENTLFFAGEATSGEGSNATMDGAIESGRRAAQEVLTRAAPARSVVSQ
jgi:monoamine oxidase